VSGLNIDESITSGPLSPIPMGERARVRGLSASNTPLTLTLSPADGGEGTGSTNRKRCSLAVSRFVVLFLADAIAAVAAPPDVTALYPAGGQQGNTVNVTLQGKVETDKLKLWCDRPGIELSAPDGKDAVQLKIASDAAPGWCWLGFYSPEGASPQRPFYIGTIPEMLETEPNNRLSDATTPLPAVFNGVLQKSGDVDVFPVSLKAGETLVAAVTAKHRLNSPIDAILQLVDARGFVLVQSDDAEDFDPRIVYTAKSDGVYALRVFGFPATPDSTIRFAGGSNFIYRLTATTGPAITRAFPSVVMANKATHVLGEGWNLTVPSEIHVPALPPGLHALDAPLGYAMRVLAIPMVTVLVDDGESPAKPQAAGVPSCVAGRVITESVWKISGTKGEKIALRTMAKALGSPLDAVLKITDAAGKTLQEVDDAQQGDADVAMEFTPPDDGEYIVTVRDRYAHGGPEYLYAMTIGTPEPDFVLSVPSDAFTFTPGKDFELTVNVESRAGFDDEIQLSVEGLPEGCDAEPVKITPQATGSSGRSGRSGRRGGGTPASSAKLIIKTTKADGWDGEFRVAGRTLDEKPLERFAVGKPANTDVPRPHLRAVVMAK
jgi:hypothetical protein